MSQKYDLGITAQYIIANKFNLEVPETVINKAKAALDYEYYNALTEVVDEIFDATTLQLVKCTSLSKKEWDGFESERKVTNVFKKYRSTGL